MRVSEKAKQKKIGRWLALVLGVAGTFGWIRVRKYLYRLVVRRLAMLDRVINETTPEQEGLPYEEIWFKSRDGLKLHGWFIPASVENRPGKATIIVGHGHGGSKVTDLRYASLFLRGGYSVFMFDFRGHGQSDGPIGTSMGYWERYDVAGAVDWLLGRGLNRLGMFGISMGGAIAILATAENPHIKTVVVDSAYSHLPRSIAAELNNMWGVPFWLARPLGWYGYRMLSQHQGFSWREGHPADVVAKIAPRPILIIHPDEDRLTRVENGHILYKKAHHPKELWIQPGLSHAQGYEVYGLEYERRIIEFLNRVDWNAAPSFVPPERTLDGKSVPQPESEQSLTPSY